MQRDLLLRTRILAQHVAAANARARMSARRHNWSIWGLSLSIGCVMAIIKKILKHFSSFPYIFPIFLYPAAQPAQGMYQSFRTKYSRLVYSTTLLGRQAHMSSSKYWIMQRLRRQGPDMGRKVQQLAKCHWRCTSNPTGIGSRRGDWQSPLRSHLLHR